MAHDVIVLGAGPAGATAAIEAARLGASVALVDEADAAGGQVWRAAPGVRVMAHEPEREAGDALRAALAAACTDVRDAQGVQGVQGVQGAGSAGGVTRIDAHFGSRVWHASRDEGIFTVHAAGPRGPVMLQARAVIVAGGAQERHVPVAGWERPGVIGLAAATVLLKAQRMLPGREVVVAGAGPLLLAVAAGIVKGGGRVAAVIDANPRAAWLRGWRGLASRPDLVVRGALWLRVLLAHRVPLLSASVIESIEGTPSVTRVSVVPFDAHATSTPQARTVDCDSVCLGFGLSPSTDLTRLLGARHAFDAGRGGWHVAVDDAQRTSVDGLFACGDATGIAGAAAAPWSGRVAAMAAVSYLGLSSGDASQHAMQSLASRRDRAARFGSAMTQLGKVADTVLAQVRPDTLVCLCERLPRATLDAAIGEGARSLGELKSATRCGMGPCGGRLCMDNAAGLLTLATGASRASLGQPTARPPLRPVGLDELAGPDDEQGGAALPVQPGSR